MLSRMKSYDSLYASSIVWLLERHICAQCNVAGMPLMQSSRGQCQCNLHILAQCRGSSHYGQHGTSIARFAHLQSILIFFHRCFLCQCISVL